MSEIPTLVVPATESRPLSPEYQSTSVAEGAFGDGGRSIGGFGGLAKEVGGAGYELGMKLRSEDNERDAKKMDIALREKIRGISFGSPGDPATGSEPTLGYFSSSGEVAMKGRNGANEALAQAYNDVLANGEGSDRAKEMFGQAAQLLIEGEKSKYDQHAFEQRKVANEATSQARINEINDDVMARYNDPKVLAGGMQSVTMEVHSRAADNGWSVDVEKSKLQEEQSKLVTGAVMSALRSQDPVHGKAIYEANKQFVDGRDRPQLEQLITQQTIRDTAQANTDAIMSMRLPKEQALAMARNKYNGVVEDQTISELKERYSETESAVDRAYTMRQRDKADKLEKLPQVGLDNAVDILAKPEGKTREGALAEAYKIKDAREQAATVSAISERFDAQEHVDVMNDRDAAKKRDQQADAEAQNILGTMGDSATRNEAADAARDNIDNSTPEGQALLDAVQKRIDDHFDFNEKVEQETYRKTQQAIASQEQIDKAALKDARDAATDWVVSQRKPLDEFYSQNPGQASILGSDLSSSNALRTADDKRALGELFARTTDGKTIAQLRSMPSQELADQNLDLLQSQLTQTEYNQAVGLVNGAKKSIQDAKSGGSYARGTEFMTKYAPNIFAGKASDTKTAKRQAALNEMNSRVSSYIETNGKEPADSDLQKWAVQLTTPISADPAGLGNSFNGITAQAVETLTPEQRAVATVDKENIPPATLKDIKSTLVAAGVSNPSDDLIEALAGQMLIGDDDARNRAKQLVDEAKRKQTQGAK